MVAGHRSFDPETLRMLQRVFEEAAAALPPETRTQDRKAALASRILALASGGETDPVRLRRAALLPLLTRIASDHTRLSSPVADRMSPAGSNRGEYRAKADVHVPVNKTELRKRHPDR